MASAEQLQEAILAQNPTDQQRNAIFADELEFLLRASPGSGKTWTSCRRFIWRAANWPHAVGGLALLSFTNAAIREFKAATVKIGRSDLPDSTGFCAWADLSAWTGRRSGGRAAVVTLHARELSGFKVLFDGKYHQTSARRTHRPISAR